MQFTLEQQDAITTHDRHVIVTAGAGSGKTRVLVARFMALLDDHPEWSLPGIVAITFTEKAAREMRDRVRSAIEARIRAAAGAQDEAALARWVAHQAALSGARIGTIHALCATLLRANPAEAGVDPAFEVLDEVEAAILREDAVAATLARLAAEDRPGTALLAGYEVRAVHGVLTRYADASQAGAVAQSLSALTSDDLVQRWRDQWDDALQDQIAAIRADAEFQAALDAVAPSDLPGDDKLADVWRAVHRHAAALRAGGAAEFEAALQGLVRDINRRGGSAKNWGGKEALTDVKEILRQIKDRANATLGEMLPRPGPRDDEAARWLACWHDAITLAAAEYARRKTQRGALDFDDLETRAQTLLAEHPAVAARYAGLDGEFRQVMVDEFQDTNPAQRAIVEALAGVMHPRDGAGGRLFVVGDPKQSIYAFRGADVSVFGGVRADLVARGGAELPLSTSFRTHSGLVDACNTVFDRVLQPGTGPVACYEVALGTPMRAQRPVSVDAEPAVTVIGFQKPDTDGDQPVNADTLRQWEAWTLAGHIHDLVARRVPVWDRDASHDDLPAGAWIPNEAREAGRGAYRPVGYGDVAILFQAMTRAPLYEEAFKAAGLPYVTVAGKGYFDRQEVWDLLNLLRALQSPDDDLALAVALRSPLFALSDDALLALRLVRDETSDSNAPLPLWTVLRLPDVPHFPAGEQQARAFAVSVLDELHGLAGRTTIADVLARALERTGYLAALTGLADGARRRGNVEKLLALAQASGRVSLGAFNAYARDLTAREVREGEAVVAVEDAVTLMSVHASKGLEFPVVVLADASWVRSARTDLFTLDPDAGPACDLPVEDPDAASEKPFALAYAAQLAARRDLAERKRLLYVGATRAADYLVVSGSLARCPANAWLRQWLDGLGIDLDDCEAADEPQEIAYDWGRCAVWLPQTLTLPADLRPAAPDAASGWDHPAVRAGHAVDGVAAQAPPLLAPVPVDPAAPARTLSASQIAKLGKAQFYDPTQVGYAAFRHSVFHDAPEPVRPLPGPVVAERDLRQYIGEIVHRALQAWLLPGRVADKDLRGTLRTFAWEQGIIQADQLADAVEQSVNLLRRFQESDVRARLDAAKQIYRELPFVFSTGERVVRGIIDVLYFDRREKWHVLDYKTAPVSFGAAYHNAQRYYLQVGVYAAAVQAKTGAIPETHLYYIYPGRLVRVRPDDWNSALARLEDDVRAALELDGSHG